MSWCLKLVLSKSNRVPHSLSEVVLKAKRQKLVGVNVAGKWARGQCNLRRRQSVKKFHLMTSKWQVRTNNITRLSMFWYEDEFTPVKEHYREKRS